MTNFHLSNHRNSQSITSSAVIKPAFILPQQNRQNSCYPENENKNGRRLAWKVASNLFVSFKYAWAGVRYAFKTQRNFKIHTAIATLAISLGLYLQISTVEISLVCLTCALVMVLELLNTAIESVVDLTVKQTYHELAKIAKDCAAGAVLISAIAAVLIATFILLPYGLNLIFSV